MGKLISVIIPVYNREAVLEECVQSVLAQSCRDFEILLIDDGSTDRTAEICRQLAQKDNRIRFFGIEHSGVSAARNFGLRQASGKYFFFLDSDDVIYPLLLETLSEAMEKSGALIGGTKSLFVNTANWYRVQKKIKEIPVPGETFCLNSEQTLASVLQSGAYFDTIGGFMLHRKLVGDTRFREDLHIGEDYFFIYENVAKSTSGVFLKEKWYYARIFQHNISRDHSFSGFRSRFYRRKLVWEREEAAGRTEYVKIQKRDAVSCFHTCVRKNKPYSEDSRSMRAVLREHKAVLFPALRRKEKLSVQLALYGPCCYLIVYRLLTKLKKRRKA